MKVALQCFPDGHGTLCALNLVHLELYPQLSLVECEHMRVAWLQSPRHVGRYEPHIYVPNLQLSLMTEVVMCAWCASQDNIPYWLPNAVSRGACSSFRIYFIESSLIHPGLCHSMCTLRGKLGWISSLSR